MEAVSNSSVVALRARFSRSLCRGPFLVAKILLIDDEAPIRANFRRILTLEGYTVVEAADGRQGLALARSESPQLIICDLRMPELDGYGLLAALKAAHGVPSVPVILLTASADAESRERCLAQGAAAYLTKPCEIAQLLAAVNAALDDTR